MYLVMADFPIRKKAYRLHFRILAENGTAKLNSESSTFNAGVSKDGGAFEVATNAVVEIDSNVSGIHQGWCRLDLTAGEMNAETVCVSIHTGGSGGRQVQSFILRTRKR